MSNSVAYPVRKPEDTDFDVERARELLDLVDIAHQEFQRSEQDQRWRWDEDKQTPKSSYDLLTRFGFAGAFLGKREWVPFGFVVRKANNIFIIFRGTMQPQEWVANSRALQVNFLGNPSLGEVHKGFHTIYTREDQGGIIDFDPNNDLPSIKNVIEATFRKSASASTKVFIAGHSLGGALATLSAFHVSQISSSPPILYTFASPRVGDQRFAAEFRSHNIECYRIANSEDRVPNLPSSITFLSMAFPKVGPLFSKLVADKLAEEYSWEHVGYPIYFTAQWGSVSDNHTIPVYKKALEAI